MEDTPQQPPNANKLKRPIFICTIILFLLGLGLGLYLIFNTIKALVLDGPVPHPTSGPPDACKYPFANSSVNIPRLMTIDDTEAVTGAITNNDTSECEVRIFLHIIDFSVSPQEPIDGYYVVVPPGKTIVTNWIIKPRELGTFKIGVVEDGINSNVFGITVTNAFGLNVWQAQLLSTIGTFLGPIAGAAWWYDRWQERKQKKRSEPELTTVSYHPGKRSKRGHRSKGR
jgi:hypothetical protein